MINLEILAFYEALPITSPLTYVLQYRLTWDHTETWDSGQPVQVIAWGPAGMFLDTFTPSLANITLTTAGAMVTRTVTVSPTTTYTPLIQDAGFDNGSPWTLINGATIAGSNLTLPANSSVTQELVLAPGTYTLVATPSSGSVQLALNGFSYISGMQFVIDATPTVLTIASSAGATLGGVTLSMMGVPAFTTSPLYVVATDDHLVVQAAVYLTNIAPATGSPQSVTSPVVITVLTTSLVPVASAPLQPSSGLNN